LKRKEYETTTISGLKLVRFNGKYSQPRSINLGVPQSKCVGPLIFLIYMNDIGSAIKEYQYNLFADDTLLSASGNSVQEWSEKLNRDLKNLSKKQKFNKLKLNVSKTKYLIMTWRRSSIENEYTSLTIDWEQIARVASMKYLGVEIDEKLNFKHHVDTTLKKMAKKVGFLGKIQQKLTNTAKITREATTRVLRNADDFRLPRYNRTYT
jgi:hypothetical protein